jgi:uncharacterized protein
MGLEEKVMSDMKDAMKAKDEAGLRGLRAIKAAIIIAKTAEGAGGELKTEDEAKLLQKLVKQRKDSLEIYEKQNREDLAKKEREEIAIILRRIIADTGASSAADMGKVMGIATKQLAGQADGKTIGAAVKELLAK